MILIEDKIHQVESQYPRYLLILITSCLFVTTVTKDISFKFSENKLIPDIIPRLCFLTNNQ